MTLSPDRRQRAARHRVVGEAHRGRGLELRLERSGGPDQGVVGARSTSAPDRVARARGGRVAARPTRARTVTTSLPGDQSSCGDRFMRARIGLRACSTAPKTMRQAMTRRRRRPRSRRRSWRTAHEGALSPSHSVVGQVRTSRPCASETSSVVAGVGTATAGTPSGPGPAPVGPTRRTSAPSFPHSAPAAPRGVWRATRPAAPTRGARLFQTPTRPRAPTPGRRAGRRRRVTNRNHRPPNRPPRWARTPGSSTRCTSSTSPIRAR